MDDSTVPPRAVRHLLDDLLGLDPLASGSSPWPSPVPNKHEKRVTDDPFDNLGRGSFILVRGWGIQEHNEQLYLPGVPRQSAGNPHKSRNIEIPPAVFGAGCVVGRSG